MKATTTDQRLLDRRGAAEWVHTDPWRVMRIQAEFVEGFGLLAELGPAVSIFGSARTSRGSLEYQAAERIAFGLVKWSNLLETGLTVSSFPFGSLLGLFLLGTLDRRANAFARELLAKGLQKNSKIAILAYNCIVTTALGYFLWGKVLSMMTAATAGQVLTLTPIGGFLLSALIFGGTVTADVVLSVILIVGGIFVTLRR